MSETVKPPEDCETMAEVRLGVDTLDRELMRLIAVRFGYMRAAARIKPERGHVRDEARKADVKRRRLQHLWELAAELVAAVDPGFRCAAHCFL